MKRHPFTPLSFNTFCRRVRFYILLGHSDTIRRKHLFGLLIILYSCISYSDEKYKKKHEARKRQEEEEKVKATHFHEREKKLQVESLERMAKYLKITDAIIDDDVIFEEEKLVLPELTPNMQVR